MYITTFTTSFIYLFFNQHTFQFCYNPSCAFLVLPQETLNPYESDSDKEDSEDDDDDALDANAILGWQRVDRLAEALLDLKGLTVSEGDYTVLVELFEDLLPYDKKASHIKAVHAQAPPWPLCSTTAAGQH